MRLYLVKGGKSEPPCLELCKLVVQIVYVPPCSENLMLHAVKGVGLTAVGVTKQAAYDNLATLISRVYPATL